MFTKYNFVIWIINKLNTSYSFSSEHWIGDCPAGSRLEHVVRWISNRAIPAPSFVNSASQHAAQTRPPSDGGADEGWTGTTSLAVESCEWEQIEANVNFYRINDFVANSKSRHWWEIADQVEGHLYLIMHQTSTPNQGSRTRKLPCDCGYWVFWSTVSWYQCCLFRREYQSILYHETYHVILCKITW